MAQSVVIHNGVQIAATLENDNAHTISTAYPKKLL